MTERLYRPLDWEDTKPHVWIPPDCKDPALYNELFNAGVEAGADAAIKALLNAIETTLLDKYGSPEPTWAEVGQAFKAYPGKLMRIIRGLW